jgi:hypothetical protein
MNKEFIRMQKLAGLMTEGLYTSDEKAPMEAMSHDGESRMTRTGLKKKIKEMMLGEAAPINTVTTMDGNTVVGTHQYGVGFKSNEIGKNKGLQDHPTSIPNGTKMVKAEMGSLDEDHTIDAYQIARELVRRMPFPDAVFASKDLFLATIDALHDELYSYAEDQFGDAGSAPDEDDDYDDSRDVYDDQYPDMAEGDLFEAKEDEESDTEDVIVAEPGDGEVPAEDATVDVTADDTQVDVNMDGVPDVDTGSPESKKAFTSLVDTYNSAKELGDPKLTQMIANALTYYNKNIILKAGQPQA